MSQQLVRKGANGRYSNVMPKSWIEAIKDKNTGQTLVEILQGFNMYFLPYNGNTSSTRCLVPTMLRKKGLWITYVKYDGNVYTEWYASNEIDDTSWGDSSNWRIGNNTLVGDITISANGNWVINGTETEFKAIGEKGNTPLLRVANNRLQVSYDLGDTYMNVTDNPVYTKFRWYAKSENIGRIQSSTDNGSTWTDMSNDFANNLHIKKYIGINESLPTSGIPEGTIYAKGPYYDELDTNNDNPIYRLWVYAWKDNTLAWQDNGEFTSIAAGVVQETGDSETEVMSQKVVTENLTELGNDINIVYSKSTISFIEGYYIDLSGKEQEDEKFACTDFLYIHERNTIKLVNCQTGNQYLSVIAFYDKYKNYISGITKITETQVGTAIISEKQIPDTTYYIRVSAGKKEANEKSAYIEYKSSKWLEAVEGVSFVLNYGAKGREIMTRKGYINLFGDYTVDSNLWSTDYLMIPLKQDFLLRGCNSSNQYASLVAFYDIHKNFISRISNVTASDDTPYTVSSEVIPSNAFYMRITAHDNFYTKGKVFVDYHIKTSEADKLLKNILYNLATLHHVFSAIQGNLYEDFVSLRGEYSDLLPINNNLTTNAGHGSIKYDISNIKGEVFITGGVRNNPYVNLWCITDSSNKVIAYGDRTDISIFETVVLNNEQNKYLYVSVNDERKDAEVILYIPKYVETLESCLFSHATLTADNKLLEATYPNGDKRIFRKMYCDEIESKTLHNLESRMCSNNEKELIEESIIQDGLLNGRLLVFSDDFDRFDDTIWNKDTFIPEPDSPYNTGKYRYLPSCVTVKDSCLVITSKPSSADGYNWDCGNVSSLGKLHLRAGRIDVKAKADRAPGQNLSIWTYGSDYTWPDCFEYDLFETFSPNTSRTSIHCTGEKSGKHNTYILKEDNINFNDWHIYSVEWNCKYIIFYRDNKVIAKRKIEDLDTVMNFVNSPQVILFQSGFNSSCSDFRNEKGDREYKFLIDWIRIYAENNVDELLSGDIKSVPRVSGIKFAGENKNVSIKAGEKYHIPYQLIPSYCPNHAFVFAESSNPNIKFEKILTIDTSKANIGDKALITIKYEKDEINYSDSFNVTIV